jgi:hypothetical protein
LNIQLALLSLDCVHAKLRGPSVHVRFYSETRSTDVLLYTRNDTHTACINEYTRNDTQYSAVHMYFMELVVVLMTFPLPPSSLNALFQRDSLTTYLMQVTPRASHSSHKSSLGCKLNDTNQTNISIFSFQYSSDISFTFQIYSPDKDTYL